MPIEIKELVIRTVLESGSRVSGSSKTDAGPQKEGAQGPQQNNIEKEVIKQLKKFRADIVSQCIEAVNEGLKRQHER